MYPTENSTHITILAKFHILNSVTVAGVIVISAIVTNWFTVDDLVWHSFSHLTNTNTSSATLAKLSETGTNVTQLLSASEHTPVILSYGVLPPIAVASVVYVVIIIIIMGYLRPSFLELPPSQYSSRRASMATKKSNNSEDERLATVEEEKLTNGLIVNGIEDINNINNTLTIKSDIKSSTDLIQDIQYLNLLEGKETDL